MASCRRQVEYLFGGHNVFKLTTAANQCVTPVIVSVPHGWCLLRRLVLDLVISLSVDHPLFPGTVSLFSFVDLFFDYFAVLTKSMLEACLASTGAVLFVFIFLCQWSGNTAAQDTRRPLSGRNDPAKAISITHTHYSVLMVPHSKHCQSATYEHRKTSPSSSSPNRMPVYLAP